MIYKGRGVFITFLYFHDHNVSTYFFLSLSFQTSIGLEKNKTRLCSGCTSTLHTVFQLFQGRFTFQFLVTLVQWRWNFCWAGLFYKQQSLVPYQQQYRASEFARQVAQQQQCMLLRVSWSSLRHLQMTPSKCCCHLTDFFDEARHCEGTIVN